MSHEILKLIEIDDFLNHMSMTSLTFSPDGEYVAFIVKQPDIESDSVMSSLWLLNYKTYELRELSRTKKVKQFFFLNNKEIVFECGSSEVKRSSFFYKLDIHSGKSILFYEFPMTVIELKNIDGRSFLLTAVYEGSLCESQNYDVFEEIPFCTNEAGITNKKRERLYLFDLETASLEPVSDPLQKVSYIENAGDGVLFVSGNFTDKYMPEKGIYFYKYSTKTTETLLEDGFYRVDYVCNYSNGDILFLGSDNKSYGYQENMNLYTLRDGKPTLLHKIRNRITGRPSIDSGSIYYLALRGMNLALHSINGISEDLICEIEGKIDGFCVHSGRIVCTARGNAGLSEIYVIKSGELEAVTEFNTNVLKGKAVSVFERFDVSYGDVLIEGYLLKPYGFKPDKKYPALLMVHYGPKSAFGCTYNHELAYYASHGYFVFCCNPRGSDGYGNGFADIRGKWGTIDYEDIMRYTDAVISKYPQIDENHLGVFGESYGGYMTNWIVGHTDRFRCAVSRSSMANLVTIGLASDIGYMLMFEQQGATPWDDPEKLWRHSPLAYADRVTTPTLFIHGERDYRCGLVEAIQMFTALKYHGTECKLCVIHGEDHSLERSPSGKIAVLTESVAWFNKYLI